uniref:Uncharacterized protein n=1 Tax=Arundo donax TaxID=35708 RepID=A0A0A9DGK3_ARUDO
MGYTMLCNKHISKSLLTIATAPVVRQNLRNSNFELIFKTISLKTKQSIRNRS